MMPSTYSQVMSPSATKAQRGEAAAGTSVEDAALAGRIRALVGAISEASERNTGKRRVHEPSQSSHQEPSASEAPPVPRRAGPAHAAVGLDYKDRLVLPVSDTGRPDV